MFLNSRRGGNENANAADGYHYSEQDEASDSEEEDDEQQDGSQQWRINDKLERNLYSLKRTQAVAADAIESMFRAISKYRNSHQLSLNEEDP